MILGWSSDCGLVAEPERRAVDGWSSEDEPAPGRGASSADHAHSRDDGLGFAGQPLEADAEEHHRSDPEGGALGHSSGALVCALPSVGFLNRPEDRARVVAGQNGGVDQVDQVLLGDDGVNRSAVEECLDILNTDLKKGAEMIARRRRDCESPALVRKIVEAGEELGPVYASRRS